MVKVGFPNTIARSFFAGLVLYGFTLVSVYFNFTSMAINSIKLSYLKVYLLCRLVSVGFRGGLAGSVPAPLADGLTPSLTYGTHDI